MSLVKVMIMKGATIPELSEVMAAAQMMEEPGILSADEYLDAEETLYRAAKKWLDLTEVDE